MSNVPLRFQARCEFCGDPIDTRRPGVYSMQQGWMKNRTQGGGNALALRETVRPAQYACGFCIEERQHHRAGQLHLFG
jgi:hypothetical protein